MNVAADGHRRLNILNIGLFDKKLFRALAQRLNFAFFDVLALFQLLNPLVEIVLCALFGHFSYSFIRTEIDLRILGLVLFCF